MTEPSPPSPRTRSRSSRPSSVSEGGSDEVQSRISLFRGLVSAPAVLSILWPAILMATGFIAWQTWGAEHVARKYYGINATQITVTAPPDYVRTNIVETVYRDTAMDQMSSLDRQVCSKVASAFASHPWVRSVVGVRKLPGGALDVRLDYRQPVAMVFVVSQHPDVPNGFFAVDGEGVLLPGSDFAEADTMKYLQIIVPGAYPTGTFGSPFGDDRVSAAALLAAYLNEHRGALKIASIGVVNDMRQTPVAQLELADAEGRRWFWGSPPGLELQGEPPASMKLDALLAGVRPGSDLRQVFVKTQ